MQVATGRSSNSKFYSDKQRRVPLAHARRSTTQHELIMNQRALLRDAIDEVKNHDYYVYQPPRVPTAMNLEVGKEDIIIPPTRRPARKGDYKYIGNSENTTRGGPPNSQRALARKWITLH